MRFLLLKHYRGGPDAHHDVPPMDQWAPEDVDAHIRFLQKCSRMEESGEFVDASALTEDRVYVQFGGADTAPVTTDGPYPETSDLAAGWYMVDVNSRERALELAAFASSDRPGEYQLQAAVAALHDDAASWEETDWPQLLGWYDDLVALAGNPVARLSRLVPLAHVHGPEAALAEHAALVDEVATLPQSEAVHGHLLDLAGNRPAAASSYARAAGRATSEPERDHLTRRAAELRSGRAQQPQT